MIYVFGNKYLEEDNLAVRVAELLNEEVTYCTTPEDLLDAEPPITVLDVVKNTEEIIVLTRAEQLQTRNIVSLHDFDLGFFLNLLEELDMGKELRIIGLPLKKEAEELSEEVKQYI